MPHFAKMESFSWSVKCWPPWKSYGISSHPYTLLVQGVPKCYRVISYSSQWSMNKSRFLLIVLSWDTFLPHTKGFSDIKRYIFWNIMLPTSVPFNIYAKWPAANDLKDMFHQYIRGRITRAAFRSMFLYFHAGCPTVQWQVTVPREALS